MTQKPLVVVLVISDLEFGGAQRQVVELANHLDPDYFDVHVCSLDDYVPLADAIRDGHRRFHIIRKRHPLDVTVIFSLARLLRSLRADVVHSFLFNAEIASRLAAQLAGHPIVISSERNANYHPKKHHVWIRRLTRHYHHLTIANSNAGAQFNRELLGQPQSHYRIVHNGVDTNRFRPLHDHCLRQELGIGENELVIGMFASFKRQKNHLLLLRAAHEMIQQRHQFRLLFVGDELHLGLASSDSYRDEISQLIDHLGLSDHCLFLGHQAEVERYYNICDLTVLPSLHEGTPNAVLESMACGVPVVATDVSDNAYVLPDGRAGFLVPSGDAASLAARMSTLLTTPALRHKFATAAREWVTAEFSGKRLAEKTADVYQEALANRE